MLSRVLEDFGAFADCFGIPLFPWQREAFGAFCEREAGRFLHAVGGISVPRGDGKSHGAAAYGLFRLMTGRRGADLISVALDEDGARVTLDHARQMRRRHPALEAAIEERADGLWVPGTSARWTVEPAPHLSTRGRHPDFVDYGEPGWASDDELFVALLAAQASVPDAQMLLTSTVGRARTGPLWRVKELAEAGQAFWYYRTENQSPLVTPAFLARQRRILTPQQYAREHENRWVDAADCFATAADVDAAMVGGDDLAGRRDISVAVGVDIGLVSDPSVIALAYAEDGAVVVGRLITFQGSRERPVSLDAVERTIRDLCEAWQVAAVRIESWQGAQLVQRLQARGIPVEQVHPTPKLHAAEWPTLAARLSSRTLVLPRHEPLREELLGLSSEVTATGVRVVDRTRVHQDHATAVRLAVAGLQDGDAQCDCGEPGCAGYHLLFSGYGAQPEADERDDDEQDAADDDEPVDDDEPEPAAPQPERPSLLKRLTGAMQDSLEGLRERREQAAADRQRGRDRQAVEAERQREQRALDRERRQAEAVAQDRRDVAALREAAQARAEESQRRQAARWLRGRVERSPGKCWFPTDEG